MLEMYIITNTSRRIYMYALANLSCLEILGREAKQNRLEEVHDNRLIHASFFLKKVLQIQ